MESTPRPVRKLSPEVARKIAAGEVIDRPASVLREFLDNAVDSGADTISASITNGGIDSITVSDNGFGMTKDDLALCTEEHTTSKIVSDTDLEHLTTLGFRGEALSSIAAVSRLTITTRKQDEPNGYTLEAPLAGAGSPVIRADRRNEGTIVTARYIFENVPARRLFLKRPQSETALCRQTFVEKALPFPNIRFDFSVDGKPRLNLPAVKTLKERFLAAVEIPENPSLFYEVTRSDQPFLAASKTGTVDSPETQGGSGNAETSGDWHFALILCDPAVSRADKKFIYIYVNGRRVQEYSLIQAIEYGSQGFFPNGTHPVAALFLTVNPALIDFNIHPAKREVRFKDISPIHRAVTAATRTFYETNARTALKTLTSREYLDTLGSESRDFADRGTGRADPPRAYADGFSALPGSTGRAAPGSAPAPGGHSAHGGGYTTPRAYEQHYPQSGSRPAPAYRYPSEHRTPLERAAETPFTSLVAEALAAQATAQAETGANEYGFRYLGQLFNVFLVVEKNGTLYLLDQHAGHERVLFNAFMAGAGQKQPLLIPYELRTETAADDDYLRSIAPELDNAGFETRETGGHLWEVTTVSIQWTGTQDDLAEAVLAEKLEPSEILRGIASYSACKAAVKEGHYLDAETARELARDIFALPDPHCPHGRPLWIEFSKEDLYRLIKRT